MEDFERYFQELAKKLGLEHIRGSWEDEWIENDGLKIHCVVFSHQEGAPSVVFIPGTSVYALCYAELLYGLYQEGFNVIGFDPRGQGQSGGIRGDYTIMEQVRDASAVCAYARKRFKAPVFIMGSSQGGIEAFYLSATDEPLAGAVCHNLADLADPESIRLARFGPKKKKNQNSAKSFPGIYLFQIGVKILRFFAKIFPQLRVPIASYLDLKSEPMRVFGNAWNFILQDPLTLRSITLRAMASLAYTPLPRPIPEIKTPILVLHSSLDHIFPEDYILKIFNQLTCDKEIIIYPDLPHLITIEHTDRIIPDIIRWLRAHC